MQSYFSVFDLPESFNVDLSDLEKRYFSKQREFHPDRLIGKTAAERQQSISQSMLINTAYEALKSPLKRANHLLALNGLEPDKIKPSGALLMEIMELREELADADTIEKLEKIEACNTANKQHIITELATAFNTNKELASELATKLSYLTKIDDEIRAKKSILSKK